MGSRRTRQTHAADARRTRHERHNARHYARHIARHNARLNARHKMVSAQVTISNRLGLHARPAMSFVEEASRFAAAVSVRKCSDGETVDGKSILQMLMLAGTCGSVLEIGVEGPDEQDALAALVALVESRFGEDE